jgi:integrase/recombinase XerD
MIAIISKLSKSKFVRRLTKGEAAKTVTLPSEETKRMKQEGKKTTSLKTPPVMLKVFTEDYIRKNPEDLAKSTLDNYRCAVNSLLRFLGGKDVSFMQFTVLRMKEFEHWLDAHSVSPNTAAVYMRSLRALYNKAPLGKRQKESNPFATVKTSNLKTDKRAAETSDLRRLAAMSLKPGTSLCFYRDIFLFCVYSMGMPFVDVAHLKKCQIHDSVIEYRRQKTGKVIRVKIEPCMQALMDRYNERGNEYVFPILKSMVHGKCEKNQKEGKGNVCGDKRNFVERQYSSALGYYNQELKVLGGMASISLYNSYLWP